MVSSSPPSGPPAVATPSRVLASDPFLSEVMDGIPTAAAIIDGAGVVAHCNEAWRALGDRTAPFGELGSLVAPSDRNGAPYVRRLAAMDGPLALPAHQLARAVQDGLAGHDGEKRLGYRMRRPDGDEAFEALVRPLRRAAHRFVLVAHVELGEREQAADATQAALRLGLEAEEQRLRGERVDHRLAALGRELNNPITSVRLELHLLRSGALGPLSEAQAKAVGVVERNVERWISVEQALLREPHLRATQAHVHDLCDLAHAAVETRQTQALKAGVQLVVHAPAGCVPVLAPGSDILEVLDLFLDGALQASPAGSVVAVEVRSSDGEGMAEVRDSGPGLSARDARLKFEPWMGRRLDGSAPPLALHHARRRIELAGGRVWAESDGNGQGTAVALAFPLAPQIPG